MLLNEAHMQDEQSSGTNIQPVLSLLRNLENASSVLVCTIIREIDRAQTVNALFDGELKNTPLRIAVIEGDVKVAQILLENGADHSLADKSGNTPLHHASFLKNTQMIRMLKNHGASDAVENLEGITPAEIQNVDRQNLENAVLVECACVLTGTTAAYCICDSCIAGGLLWSGLMVIFKDIGAKNWLGESTYKTLFFQKDLIRKTPPNIEFMLSEPSTSDNVVPANRP